MVVLTIAVTKAIDGETYPVPVVQRSVEPEPGIYRGSQTRITEPQAQAFLSRASGRSGDKQKPSWSDLKFPPVKKETAQTKATKDLAPVHKYAYP